MILFSATLMLLLGVLGCRQSLQARMEVDFAWTNVDFHFPSPRIKDQLIESKEFIPNNIAVLDVDLYKCKKCDKLRIFVTTPRFKPGTPATLSTVDENGLLSPYPSWNWHNLQDCGGITSVLRLAIDECGRLWVLDSGTVDQFEDQPKFPCPPKIMLFDLETNKSLGYYEIPYKTTDSLFGNIVVEVDKRHCAKAFAYLADITGYQLVTFNLEKKSFWAWNNTVLRPDPKYTNFTSNGVSFTLEDGVLALAYYPRRKRLYFNSFASLSEHTVSTLFLHEGDKFLHKQDSYFEKLRGARTSQSTVHAITYDGVLFFNPISDNSIRCWSVETPYKNENHIVVAQDDKTLQFITGIKVRQHRLWAVTARLQNFIVGRVSPSEVNYRIVSQNVNRLIRGTKCARRSWYWD